MGHVTNGMARKHRGGGALAPAMVVACLSLVLSAFADTPQYGGLTFTAGVEIDGVSYPDGTTVYATSWPTQMIVKPIVPDGETFMCFNISGTVISQFKMPTQLFLDYQNRAFVTPPYMAGVITTFKPQYANFVKWVDAENGNDKTGKGTAAEPWKALQYAVDQCPNNSFGILMAKRGVYREGGTNIIQNVETRSSWTRVDIREGKRLLLKAEEGPEVTAIEGAPDYVTFPQDPSSGLYGCGSNACRCVSFGFNNAGDASVQGFTIRNGYSGYTTSNWSAQGYSGGVLAQWSGVGLSQHQVLDCVISNCHARCRAALSYVHAYRCRLADIHNVYSSQGPCNGSVLVSCLCEGSSGGGATKGIHNSCKDSWPQTSWNSCGDSFWLGAFEYYGSVMRGGSWSGPIGITKDSVIYVDDANRDYRLDATSKGYGGTTMPEVGSTYWTNWTDNYAAFATSDLNGERITYLDGVPVSGAMMNVFKKRFVYIDLPADIGMTIVGATANETNRLEAGSVVTMTPDSSRPCDALAVVLGSTTNWFAELPGGTYTYTVPADFNVKETDVFTFVRGKSQAVLVTIPSTAGVDVTGVTAGEVTYMSPGRTFTLTPNETKKRYALGVVVGGVTNLFLELPDRTYTYTVPEDFVEGATNAMVVLVSNDWYVSPTGSDSANGFTPTSPWRTLCYAMKTCAAGQRVLALPGIYAEGVTTRDNVDYPTTFDKPRCRVSIWGGRSLVSTDGPEKTIIMGAPATTPDADEYGRGTNAVSCVRITNASTANPVVVRGFTLTGGRTRMRVGRNSDEFSQGSAVHSLWENGANVARIENCIVTNNFTDCGTGGGTMYSCYFADNVGKQYSVAGCCDLIGCVVKNGSAVDLHNCRNCTFGPGATFGMRSDATYQHCENAVVLGTIGWHGNNMVFSNSVILTGREFYAFHRVGCVVTNEAAMALNEDFVPTNKASAVVDAGGSWDDAYGRYIKTVTDAYGNPRVYNGTIDAGAVEFDWRGEYSKDVSKRGGFSVTNATSEVVESATGTVVISNGQHLAGVWTTVPSRRRARVGVHIVGEGTFAVKVGGVTVATLADPTAAPVFVEFPVTADAVSPLRQDVEFSFSGSGSAEIYKTDFVRGFVLMIR